MKFCKQISQKCTYPHTHICACVCVYIYMYMWCLPSFQPDGKDVISFFHWCLIEQHITNRGLSLCLMAELFINGKC